MRASRLVSLLLLLQTRGQLTAAELARELEVSERTVHRDVEALSASGVPIYAERGAHGGIRLVDGYRTRLTGMTPEEAEALFLAGLPGPAAELGLGTVVAAAQLKVLASLPSELRARASRLVERFHLDAGDWFRASQPVPHLGALSDAVWNATRVTIRYEREGGPVERTIEPLGVVLKAGIWYVVAGVDGVDGQLRTYRVSRVVGVGPVGEAFSRPANFDLATYWAESSAAFERDVPRIAVDIRVRPDRLDELQAITGHAVVEAAEYLPDPDPEGWLRLRLRMDWPDEAPRVLLGAGRWVEVLGPPDVRAQAAATARAIAEHYADPG
jgi:predicted DNA-binding transcriptional regulator YafY